MRKCTDSGFVSVGTKSDNNTRGHSREVRVAAECFACVHIGDMHFDYWHMSP